MTDIRKLNPKVTIKETKNKSDMSIHSQNLSMAQELVALSTSGSRGKSGTENSRMD